MVFISLTYNTKVVLNVERNTILIVTYPLFSSVCFLSTGKGNLTILHNPMIGAEILNSSPPGALVIYNLPNH